MKDDKINEVGQKNLFISNVFWLTSSNQNLTQFKKNKWAP